ncbi:MAG: malto-oligosyltrehalose trehalohydrolase [Candidatus Rokuibacteriota bacterium]
MRFDLGAVPTGSGAVRFRVWAPYCRHVSLHVVGPGPARQASLEPEEDGVFTATLGGVAVGTRYFYRPDGGPLRPDPVSRSQPDGVHGPSEVVDLSTCPWTDAGWRGVSLRHLRLYELHVGTFTPEGTFEAVVPRLPYLRDLGITAIELMPVAEFPGARNWGYDGVHLFAPQSTYGGPLGLMRLVDAAHRLGLAVLLDVVYNHVGPEGNYLRAFGPYFRADRRTPWGDAMNYDGDGSSAVRRHVLGNAGSWIRDYHLDGLRLDAVHAITDESRVHILAELAEAVATEARALDRVVHVIAEANRNERRIVLPRSQGGLGLASQWSGDLHHALRVTLTGIRGGYYDDFPRGLDDLEVALRDAFVYQGQVSAFRGGPLGTSAAGLPGEAFVVFAQNHDQVGNQVRGDRLMTQVSLAAVKLAAASVLLAPYLPLLFMGEEYGETAPFCFFTSFGDPALAEAVRAGRSAEFSRFAWTGDGPDPQDPATFALSRLDHTRRLRPPHAHVFAWYQALLRLRRTHPALSEPERDRTVVTRVERALILHRWAPGPEAALIVLAYEATPTAVELTLPEGDFVLALDSEAAAFGGSGDSLGPSRLPGGRAALALRAHHALVYMRQRRPPA